MDNFKSLVNFRVNFARFSCLVGLNGAGKSTVLQAVDFLSQLMRGDLDSWLSERSWAKSDLNSKLSARLNLDFKVNLQFEALGELVWKGSVNRNSLHCTAETVQLNGESLLKVHEGECSLRSVKNVRAEKFKVVFEYQGSILSQLKESQITGPLLELRNELLKVHSLDLLSPAQLRMKTRNADGQLGLGGQRLSAYLHELGKEKREFLKNRLASVYTQLESIDTKSLRSGWKQLGVKERFGSQLLTTPAEHINDGMLRLMAILSQLDSDQHFLVFDEIENGINPELVEFLIDALVTSSHQVLVTTHSPLVLNYLEDEVAKEGLIYLYKNDNGATQAIPFFSIPSMAKKLQAMGPGEVFVDTHLSALAEEISEIDSVT
ncbi:putative ATPase [Desulfurispira natronophila]|uniref:Putative ATPase n=1 Tax=Desulfurispira natronophila TaxID=682562 RepID=A0A7W8DH25_9BACT|nr:putative ATPase [Desulfurispira natronophila]